MKNGNKEITRKYKFGEKFPPESIAIVGISRNDNTNIPGYTGLQMFRSLRDTGFKGRLYPVNPKADEIEGVKAYPSVKAIPESPDLVIITVPAPIVPQIIEDCVEAGAFYAHICSSGFSETGEAEGKLLEDQILEKSMKSNLMVIGPNSMGINIPSANIKMYYDLKSFKDGSVAFLTQSGGLAHIFFENSPELGIGFSKVISYGNGIMLDAADFLEYLADDDKTKIICMYIEGIKDGRRLIELVKEVNTLKPVIMWKGGLTGSGARAVASHTGSMAGDREIWNGFFKQTGAVKVETLQEMGEAAMVFQNLQSINGKRAVVLGAGGGSTVSNGDICTREGLEVPALSLETGEELSQFVSSVNQIITNPMDVPSMLTDPETFNRAFDLFMNDSTIDMVIISLPMPWMQGRWGGEILKNNIKNFIQERPNKKPIVVSVSDDWYSGEVEQSMREYREAGITTFRSLTMACRALRRFADYHKFKSS